MGIDAYFSMNATSGEKAIAIEDNGNIKYFIGDWRKMPSHCEGFIANVFEYLADLADYSCEVELHCIDGESKKRIEAWQVHKGKKAWLPTPERVIANIDYDGIVLWFYDFDDNSRSPKFALTGFAPSDVDELVLLFCDYFYNFSKTGLVRLVSNGMVRVFDMAANEILASNLTDDQKALFGI